MRRCYRLHLDFGESLLQKPLLSLVVLTLNQSPTFPPFLGKIIEKDVGLQLQNVMGETFFVTIQVGCGIKTAVVTVIDDLWQNQEGENDFPYPA